MSNRPKPRSFLPLHPLEMRILLVLVGGPAHGYRIVKEIEALDARWTTIYPANLYRRIRRLLDDGLVAETDAPDAVEAETDDRRTYLEVTDLGREVARAEAERLRALMADPAVRDLLETAP